MREISTPIVLDHNNLIPGTEVVSIKGAPIPSLIRDVDYIIDYINGEIKFLADGAAVAYSQLIEQNGVDVNYSYQLQYQDPALFESQKEIFNETAKRIENFKLSVLNGPISNVSRVLNQTTQELYTVTSIHQNQISFTGNNSPAIKSFTSSCNLQSTIYDSQYSRHINTYKIVYPSSYDPKINQVVDLFAIRSTSLNLILVVIGGEEPLNTRIVIDVPFEAVDIQLTTGGRSLKQSNTLLISGTDYTAVVNNVLADTDYKQFTINLLPSGVQKIRTNNLYLNLAFSEQFQPNENGEFTTKSLYTNYRVDIINNQATLNIPRYVTLGTNSDQSAPPIIQVMDPSTRFIYQEGIDYNILLTQQKLDIIENGRIKSNQILIYYIDNRKLQIDYSIVSDVILVDYVWGSNSLNWEKQRKLVPITQVEDLKKGTQTIILTHIPADSESILIYLYDDTTKKQAVTPLSFNKITQRLIVEPVNSSGKYVLEYIAVSEPIQENQAYFVSYKYGATRDVLKDKFARMVGITNTTTEKEDVISLSAGSTSAQLTGNPNSLDEVLIFLQEDNQETPQATPTKFDNITKILYFTSVRISGMYVVRYISDGFNTSNLRTATQQMFQSYIEGPTLKGFQDIIAGFVSTPPIITSGLTNRFVLPNKDHTIGNQITLKQFETSPALSDGTKTVGFVPARFNLGALIESSKEGFVKAPANSNIGFQEGTLEFLTGTVFETNDQREHYFLDVLGKDSKRNRFSIYKSKQGRINFDILDNKGQLFRATADVSQVYYTEIIQLKAGDSKAILTYNATPAQLDLNSNQTPDLYEALETKFIIMPETPTFPEKYKKASIKVLSYDAPTKTIEFEPIGLTGRYIFSYVGGLVKFEETENFIAVTWKLHTNDGEAPFYKLYINGRKIINQTLQDINFTGTEATKGTYDNSIYDIDVYRE